MSLFSPLKTITVFLETLLIISAIVSPQLFIPHTTVFPFLCSEQKPDLEILEGGVVSQDGN